MIRPRFYLLLSLFLVGLVGCDRSAEFENCFVTHDPGASPGGRAKSCATSEFATETPRAREVFGRVRRGEELVAGALVRVDRTADGRGNAALPLTTMTDEVGFFSGLRAAPFRYDISAAFDDTVVLFRDISARYFEPSVDTTTRTFGRAWTGHVAVAFDRQIGGDRAVAFFVTGDGAYAVTGDAQSGLSVLTDKYSTTATLHAIEYEQAGGLEKATAYAKVDVLVDAADAHFARFVLAPITTFASPKFSAKAPAGFLPTTVDVVLAFSPTSDARLATVPINGARSLPVIPGIDYHYRALATAADGAVSDTGESGFDVNAPETPIVLPEPPIAVSPASGETRGANDALSVSGAGVFEHLLVSQTHGPTLRIVASAAEVVLPDVQMLGASAAVGPYTWTVRSFPSARLAEDLGGLRSRRYRPMAASAPRTLVLR